MKNQKAKAWPFPLGPKPSNDLKEAYPDVRFVQAKKEFGYGVTIAYRPTVKGENAVTIDVAVAYCSPEDKFKWKTGKLEALSNLDAGEIVKLPLAYAWKYHPEWLERDLLTRFA